MKKKNNKSCNYDVHRKSKLVLKLKKAGVLSRFAKQCFYLVLTLNKLHVAYLTLCYFSDIEDDYVMGFLITLKLLGIYFHYVLGTSALPEGLECSFLSF